MKNRILKALPTKEYRLIDPHLKLIELRQDAVLYDAAESAGEVFFPEDAAISMLSGTSAGETLEICVIGNEGIVGLASLLGNITPCRATVQIPGKAYRISRDALRKELRRCDTLRQILLQYTAALLIQIAQTAVCNKFHSVEERLCRWLLMAHDRSVADRVALTQETLARLLGSRRASVSVTASALQRMGAIRYSRGIIEIIDRKHLESASCECYENIFAAHSKTGDIRKPFS